MLRKLLTELFEWEPVFGASNSTNSKKNYKFDVCSFNECIRLMFKHGIRTSLAIKRQICTRLMFKKQTNA